MIAVRISEDALRDPDDGFAFYDLQETGLGDYFASCLRADIESCAYPAAAGTPARVRRPRGRETGGVALLHPRLPAVSPPGWLVRHCAVDPGDGGWEAARRRSRSSMHPFPGVAPVTG